MLHAPEGSSALRAVPPRSSQSTGLLWRPAPSKSSFEFSSRSDRSLQACFVQAECGVRGAGLGSEGHAQAIPRIDRHDGESEIGDFLFGQLAAHALVDVIWHALLRQLRDYFGPREGG